MFGDAYLATLGVLAACVTVAAPLAVLRWAATARPVWWVSARRSVRRYRRNRR